MPGEKAAMVISDPPWNVPNDGFTGGLGKIHHADFAMAAGEMSDAEFFGFLTRMLEQMMLHSIDGALLLIFMDWRHQPDLVAAGKALGLRYLNLCVWVKNNGGMGSHYRSQHELVVVFKHGAAPHRNNIQLGKFNRNRTNVWHYDGMNSFGRTGEEGNLLAMHPTVKPVKMIAEALKDSSKRGDIILDPFLGSGTTLMAAERTKRTLRGIELDPRYVDVAVRRWQEMTGGDARDAETGRTFSEIAAAKENSDG